MSWIDSAIEQSSSPMDCDVKHLRISNEGEGFIEVIQFLPLTAHEYQVLKAHPEIRSVTNPDDKLERLGLLVTFEMMRKCDASLDWKKFKQLPLTLLNDLSTAILAASRGEGGEEDESPFPV
jgi:hypothetical protein